MAVNLFTFIDLYDRVLAAAAHLLDKGEQHAAAKGVSEAEWLGWRLAEDMHPLGFQLMVVINFAGAWPARVADVPVPAPVGADLGLNEFKAAIAETRRFLSTLTPAQFDGVDDRPLTHKIVEGMEPTMPAGHWLTVFATTNIYFHLSTTYAILRTNGVPIGKADLFPRGL